jgi:hypothetical protein
MVFVAGGKDLFVLYTSSESQRSTIIFNNDQSFAFGPVAAIAFKVRLAYKSDDDAETVRLAGRASATPGELKTGDLAWTIYWLWDISDVGRVANPRCCWWP